MSSIWLLLSLFGTFGAIAIAVVAVELGRAERSRTVELLQAQVRTTVPDIRLQDLERPLAERAILPFVAGLGSVGRRITPLDMRRRIAKKLVLAGSPAGWDAERVAALKVVGGLVGLGLSIFVVRAINVTGGYMIGVIVLLTAMGYLLPDVVLARAVDSRQGAIRKALPDTMDLLTISVEAGLGFDAALAQVVQNVAGPLAEELSRMLQEVQLGVSRADAFRHLGQRSNVDEMSAFVLAMVQADVFGVSVSKVLRAQAKELRTKRRQNAERIAMQIPVKILFPMIFCVMPALFVVVIGPGAIRIFQNFVGRTP
jgi:tight adherence protein C